MQHKIITYLNLFRWPNLLILLASMSIILVAIIVPGLNIRLFVDGLSLFQFSLLVSSTIFIAIGGYIINDVFDIHADLVNKKDITTIGTCISVGFANTLYWITTIVGILLGVLLSYLVNQINFGLIFLFSAGLLWFYSQKYQCQPLVGNVVVAFLSALSFGLVWLFEFYALSSDASVFVNVQSQFSLVNQLVLIYMGFAFVVSLLREVVKDMEDYEGDNRFGCITFAVKYGVDASKKLALIIAYISLFAGVYVQLLFYNLGLYLLLFSFFIIDVLFISVILMLHKAVNKPNFSKLSLQIKLLMLVGIISMVLFYFEK